MKKKLRRYLPDHATVHGNRWLRPFANTLLHPRLWHLNRHSAAGAVAVGLFCGLIPGPFQMLGAALACIVWRVNLPLALITTLYTNPLTIVPLYLVAYAMGTWTLGLDSGGFVYPPDFTPADIGGWLHGLAAWTLGLGKPLLVGLLELGALLSLSGYVAVRSAWRHWLIRNWRARAQQRANRPAPR